VAQRRESLGAASLCSAYAQGETPCTPSGGTPALRGRGSREASGGATGPRREGLM